MDQRRAELQVEGLAPAGPLLNELNRCLNRPLQVVLRIGLFQVAEIDVLRPVKAAVRQHPAVLPLVECKGLLRSRTRFRVALNILQAVVRIILPVAQALNAADMVFPDESCAVACLRQHRSHVQAVRFEPHVEGRKCLLPGRTFLLIDCGARPARIATRQEGIPRGRAHRARDESIVEYNLLLAKTVQGRCPHLSPIGTQRFLVLVIRQENNDVRALRQRSHSRHHQAQQQKNSGVVSYHYYKGYCGY